MLQYTIISRHFKILADNIHRYIIANQKKAVENQATDRAFRKGYGY